MKNSLAEEKKYYVYTLAYPESMGGETFYVGKGTGKRIDVHEIEARTSVGEVVNSRKVSIIRSIWENGEKVVKRKIAFFDDELEAYMYEWAMAYMTCRSDLLTNSVYHQDSLRPHPVPKVLVEFDLTEETQKLLSKLSQQSWMKEASILEWAIRDFARQQNVRL